MAPTLGYWDIRGLAEQIRLLLRYLKVEYQEKLYKPGPAPDYDRGEWMAEKFNLGLPFPNLPYYIDGDFRISQSSAILEYIADTHNMIPNCKKQRAILHMVMNDVMDFRLSFARMCYSPDFETLKVDFMKTLPDKLKKYEDYLGDRKWLSGDKINYPDFNLCEILNQLKKFEPSCLEDFHKLKAYLNNFENLPELKEYMASEEFKTRNCNYIVAKWR
nr:glutathione S transferase [Hymenolepis microstoma]